MGSMKLKFKATFMAVMVLFSALFSHWAVAIPLPDESVQSAPDLKVQMAGHGCHGGAVLSSDQVQDLPQMSYAHYCPYCHGPCHFDMEKCHVIFHVADLMTHQYSFELPTEKPVFTIQSTLPVAPTSKEIRPPRAA